MKVFYSPLRYPGGKNKIVNFIKLILKKNELTGGTYVEPYAGGASVALTLLIDDFVKDIIINDYDRSVYAFWYSVINNTNELCDLIENTDVSIDNWKIQKQVQINKEKVGLLELGFSTFFLNRTNRSGIIKAGVIGGNEQLGNFKIDARYNKGDLISKIRLISMYSDNISLYNLDMITLIKKLKPTLPTNSFIYFDPPYYCKGKDLYVNHYQHKDHLLVAKLINGIRNPHWIVSYDNVTEVKEMYKNKQTLKYKLSYSAINARKGSELLIFNKTLKVPKITPTKVANQVLNI